MASLLEPAELETLLEANLEAELEANFEGLVDPELHSALE